MPEDSREAIRSYEPLFGSWHIVEEIGEGSFGIVYRVTKEEMGRRYDSAVKMISIPSREQYRDIVFGHNPANQGQQYNACSAGVIQTEGCNNLVFLDCDLYGCGSTGFLLDQSQNVLVQDTKVHNCYEGALLIYSCQNITFLSSEICYNGTAYDTDYSLINVDNTSALLFKECYIHDNGGKAKKNTYLINTDNAKKITLTDTRVENNTYSKISYYAVIQN